MRSASSPSAAERTSCPSAASSLTMHLRTITWSSATITSPGGVESVFERAERRPDGAARGRTRPRRGSESRRSRKRRETRPPPGDSCRRFSARGSLRGGARRQGGGLAAYASVTRGAQSEWASHASRKARRSVNGATLSSGPAAVHGPCRPTVLGRHGATEASPLAAALDKMSHCASLNTGILHPPLRRNQFGSGGEGSCATTRNIDC